MVESLKRIINIEPNHSHNMIIMLMFMSYHGLLQKQIQCITNYNYNRASALQFRQVGSAAGISKLESLYYKFITNLTPTRLRQSVCITVCDTWVPRQVFQSSKIFITNLTPTRIPSQGACNYTMFLSRCSHRPMYF